MGCGNKREGWGFYVGVLSLKKKNKTEREVGFLGCGAELVKPSVEESLVFLIQFILFGVLCLIRLIGQPPMG